jgi:hypothetical protein
VTLWSRANPYCLQLSCKANMLLLLALAVEDGMTSNLRVVHGQPWSP